MMITNCQAQQGTQTHAQPQGRDVRSIYYSWRLSCMGKSFANYPNARQLGLDPAAVIHLLYAPFVPNTPVCGDGRPSRHCLERGHRYNSACLEMHQQLPWSSQRAQHERGGRNLGSELFRKGAVKTRRDALPKSRPSERV